MSVQAQLPAEYMLAKPEKPTAPNVNLGKVQRRDLILKRTGIRVIVAKTDFHHFTHYWSKQQVNHEKMRVIFKFQTACLHESGAARLSDLDA